MAWPLAMAWVPLFHLPLLGLLRSGRYAFGPALAIAGASGFALWLFECAYYPALPAAAFLAIAAAQLAGGALVLWAWDRCRGDVQPSGAAGEVAQVVFAVAAVLLAAACVGISRGGRSAAGYALLDVDLRAAISGGVGVAAMGLVVLLVVLGWRLRRASSPLWSWGELGIAGVIFVAAQVVVGFLFGFDGDFRGLPGDLLRSPLNAPGLAALLLLAVATQVWIDDDEEDAEDDRRGQEA